MANTVTNSFTATGDRTSLIALQLLMRGPDVRLQELRAAKVRSSYVVEEDGQVSSEFAAQMEAALATGVDFLRVDTARKSIPAQGAEALALLDESLRNGLKGDKLQRLMRERLGIPDGQRLFARGTKLDICMATRAVQEVVFDGALPEPAVVTALSRLIAKAPEEFQNELRMMGSSYLAAHYYSDKQVGMKLPRDPDMMAFLTFERDGIRMASMALVCHLLAPEGRRKFNENRWGVPKNSGSDARISMRLVAETKRAPNPFASITNFLMGATYALDVEFKTQRSEATGFLKALELALPEVKFGPLAVEKVIVSSFAERDDDEIEGQVEETEMAA